MQQFGQYLKSEREKRGVRLEEIASSTKIHIQNLNLMEEDRWKDLPQEPFIRGFISAYARYLGLDNKETLKLFSDFQTPPEKIVEENEQASASSSKLAEPNATFNPPPKESSSVEVSEFKPLEKAPLPKSTQIKAVLAAGVLLGVTLVVMMTRSSTDTAEPEVQVQTNNQAVPAAPATPETSALQPTTPTEAAAPTQVEAPKENSDGAIVKAESEPPKKESENPPAIQTQANTKLGSEIPTSTESKSEPQKTKKSVENSSPPKPTTPPQTVASASAATNKEPVTQEPQT
ncbi:MAG: helix-turn-helix domain-containing protein, partial [Deltaproteobacteria bacterium]